jgi:uncharacterized membrane protein
MIAYLAAYIASAVAMIVLDMVWLGLIAKSLYQDGIGYLMAPNPVVPVAALFYAVYALGVLVFAVIPGSRTAGWGGCLGMGALLGLVAYSTYDLSNLATLRGWPGGLAVIDICWGVGISTVCAACGRLAWNWAAKA